MNSDSLIFKKLALALKLNLFNKLGSIDESILSKNDSNISKVVFLGDHSFNGVENASTLIILFIFFIYRWYNVVK